jgi:predicted Zn finger-like uncharacterized protein
MIDPFMHCEKCSASFRIFDERLITAKRKWGYYWKCSNCGTRNKWEQPSDRGGMITL